MSGGKIDMEKDDLTTNQAKAEKKAETVRNYRSSTPNVLNDTDHFAYVIGYKDGLVKPYGLITRAETTTIFFRLLKDSVGTAVFLPVTPIPMCRTATGPIPPSLP